MKVRQKTWSKETGWQNEATDVATIKADLVFAFGNRFVLEDSKRFEEIQKLYDGADIICCSTSGEIIGQRVQDDSITLTAIAFEKTSLFIEQLNAADFSSSSNLGTVLSKRLLRGSNNGKDKLRHVMVFSDGGLINGSELVEGLNSALDHKVSVTGGLAGDGARFEKTLVGWNEAPSSGNVIGIGFYSEDLKIGYGSVGGWDAFGPKRKVTRSEGNVLYEIDGVSALELYKKYLGDKAKELPASALLFPLNLQLAEGEKPLVRTILSVNEEDQSMTFAGNLPEGSSVQLMKADFEKIIDAAHDAAENSSALLGGSKPELAILISCVGRKLILDQLVEDEVESTAQVVGEEIPQIGFYSYGEIAPFSDEVSCQLHNQTMTVTLFSEQ